MAGNLKFGETVRRGLSEQTAGCGRESQNTQVQNRHLGHPAFAAEENVFVESVAGVVSLGEDVAAGRKSKPAPLKITRDGAPRQHSVLHPPSRSER